MLTPQLVTVEADGPKGKKARSNVKVSIAAD